jgi:hypothetical protein
MSEAFATGRCLCGAVSYTISSEPVRMAQCHCDHCQRTSGTGHNSIAFFKADTVDIKGETQSYSCITDRGNTSTRHFCPTCGSRLFGENSGRPGVIGITIGCVDQKDWFKPQAVVYTRGRPNWDATSQDIPNFDTMPPPT